MKINELTRKLTEAGCKFIRNGTRHEIWYSPLTLHEFILPRHQAKKVATGTLNIIAKQSGVKL
ncbi:MAG: type II toxin-antitoxin system HicA family toxin [Bacteroidales bacterium]|nr:type II toxin-antitoxin system HicA family toxin [Bacteroidales bacterium]